jgi:hypothetical protein
VLAAAGALLLIVGGKEAAEARILAPPQSTEAFKENVQWLEHQTN